MNQYEVVIVGGGINGCGLLRDLALNGVKTLLIERGDFASQTSQRSSKMLHGGIRYLENFDFALVQEALEEKNLWLKLTPHLCYEQDFTFPLYQNSKYAPWMLNCGLWLYDFLSHFQNHPHGMLSKEETIRLHPDLNPQGLKGAGRYYDGIVDDAQLTLASLEDALCEPQVKALNFHSIIGVDQHHSGLLQVTYQSIKSGPITSALTEFLVFTTGPFTDQLLAQLHLPWSPQLLPSKGIHLWLHPHTIKVQGPLVLTTPEGRVVFVIPHQEAILVGTTETPVQEEIFNIEAHDEEIHYLLHILKEYFPHSPLTEKAIISTYAGVRPLVREEGTLHEAGRVSRFHKIFRPNSRTYVLLGGKLTTFRRMAQELAQEIVPRLGRVYRPQLTLSAPRRRGL